MNEHQAKLSILGELIAKHTQQNGLNHTLISELKIFRESRPHGRISYMYEPALIIAAQGTKDIYLDGNRYSYSAGNFLALFIPMAVECALEKVSEEEPLLGLGIRLDRHRLAKLLLKMDAVAQTPQQPVVSNSSGIFSAPLNHALLDASIRLLKSLDDPVEAAVLGEPIIDEIYYRLLSGEQGGALKVLLRQQGQIQQISKAVEHLHENLNQQISVEELANLVSMSSSGFHKKFKEVMHLSPLQYVKLVRLNKAKTYITEGKNISEAAYMVGYNSLAQFSREYKRQFGVAPSVMLGLQPSV